MRHGSGHGQNHSETVEHRHLNHHTIRGGKAHPVTDAFSVIYHIVMGQHDALWESCGSGSILHIADVVRFDPLCHGFQCFNRNGISAFHGFLESQATLLHITDCNNIPEEGKLFAVQGFTCFGFADFRTEFVDYGPVITVQSAFDHHKGMGIALTKQVFRFMNLIGGIDGYQNRADSGCRPESDIPGWYIGGPDSHF